MNAEGVKSKVTVLTKDGQVVGTFEHKFTSIGHIVEFITEKFPNLPKGGVVSVKPI